MDPVAGGETVAALFRLHLAIVLDISSAGPLDLVI